MRHILHIGHTFSPPDPAKEGERVAVDHDKFWRRLHRRRAMRTRMDRAIAAARAQRLEVERMASNSHEAKRYRNAAAHERRSQLRYAAAVRAAPVHHKKGPVDMAETTPPEPIMQFFGFEHLPDHLQAISKPFSEQAERIVATLPRNAERTVALRKLLESKDAAVRASIAR